VSDPRSNDLPVPPPGLGPDERQGLLRLAREAMRVHLESGKLLDPSTSGPEEEWAGGVFVTLRQGRGLRGCIGWIRADAPLHRAVVRCAVASATADPRFEPVGPEELPGLSIEISLLSAPIPVDSPAEVRVGRDGLIVEKSGSRGLLLPQVAVEQGWDRETFLREVCRKAGLRPDDWMEGARLQRFTAEVFGEEEVTAS